MTGSEAAECLPRLALSVRQPWAELILDGRKSIEIRNWHSDFRGRVWLHTGARSEQGLESKFGFASLPHAAFVGSVKVSAIVPLDSGRWSSWRSRHLDEGRFQEGAVAWLLDSPRRFPAPVPGRGSLRLFEPETSVFSALRTQERMAIDHQSTPATERSI